MSRSVRELTGSGGNEPHPIFNESLINQTTTYSKASVWILALMQAKAGVCVFVCVVLGGMVWVVYKTTQFGLLNGFCQIPLK